jgi:hypothetical protein
MRINILELLGYTLLYNGFQNCMSQVSTYSICKPAGFNRILKIIMVMILFFWLLAIQMVHKTYLKYHFCCCDILISWSKNFLNLYTNKYHLYVQRSLFFLCLIIIYQNYDIFFSWNK